MIPRLPLAPSGPARPARMAYAPVPGTAFRTTSLWTKQLGIWRVESALGCITGCAGCYAGPQIDLPSVERFVRRVLGIADDEPFDLVKDWGNYLVVYENIVERVRAEIPRRARGEVWMCGLTDPLQVVGKGNAIEPFAVVDRTVAVVVQLAGAGFSVRIFSKWISPTVSERLVAGIPYNARPRISVYSSIPATDGAGCRLFQQRGSGPETALRGLERLRDAGFRVGISASPILPVVSDGSEAIRTILTEAAELGAEQIFIEPLNVRGAAFKHFLDNAVARGRSDAAAHAREVAGGRRRAAYVEDLVETVAREASEVGIANRVKFWLDGELRRNFAADGPAGLDRWQQLLASPVVLPALDALLPQPPRRTPKGTPLTPRQIERLTATRIPWPESVPMDAAAFYQAMLNVARAAGLLADQVYGVAERYVRGAGTFQPPRRKRGGGHGSP